MRAALDTSVLAYAEGIDEAGRRAAAPTLVRRLPQETTVVPVQALGELFDVLVRKGGKSRSDALMQAQSLPMDAGLRLPAGGKPIRLLCGSRACVAIG